MNMRAFRVGASIALILSVLSPRAGHAQLDRSSVRGQVLDERGLPLPGVQVEMEFKGESRQKIVKKMTTDKKGAYIHMGLLPGPWVMVFTKDGLKSARLETYLSGGGLSEIQTVTLSVAPPAAPPAAAAEKAGASPAVAATPAPLEIGLALARSGDAVGAEAAFRKAIEVQPGTAAPYLALTLLLGKAKRGEEALKLLQDAAGGFAQDATFQFALAATAFDLGRGPEAEAAFTKVAELDAMNAEAHFYLASLALNRNDVPAAVTRLEKYVAMAPTGAPNLEAAKALLASLKKPK